MTVIDRDETALCRPCGNTFAGPAEFAAHRRRGGCLDPVDVDMQPLPRRRDVVWGFPKQPALFI